MPCDLFQQHSTATFAWEDLRLGLLKGPVNYVHRARDLSRYWRRPFPEILGKMVASRVFYDRGPVKFDEFGFATKPLVKWREYIVEETRERLQRASAPPEHRLIEEDKLQFWARCTEQDLPVVPIVAVLANRHASVPAGIRLAANAGELHGLLASLGNFDGFAKPVAAGQGYGAFTFDVRDGVVTTRGGSGTADYLYDICVRSAFNRGGYLLQPRLRPHPDLVGIMPGPGLGTIRLISFLGRDGRLDIPWAVLKAPRNDAVVCHPRLHPLMTSVDMTTGRLGTAFGPIHASSVMAPQEGHPVTGMRFADVVVPDWPEIKDLVSRAAHVFPELPCLGWDIAVTPDGPVLLEANWNFGMSTQQTCLDRGLQAEFVQFMGGCLPTPVLDAAGN